MTNQEFKDLIDRYQTGRCSAEEQQRLESWLDEIETNDQRFEDWAEERKSTVGQKLFLLIRQQIKKRVPRSEKAFFHFRGMKVAASIIILLGCCFGLYRASDNWHARQDTATSLPQGKKHILSDGTIVWLKGNSHLHYPITFTGDKREVRLIGEALFEVAKDSLRPFLIHCDSLLTTVLGTSFNIKSQPHLQQVEVVVFTGKVALSTLSKQSKMLLTSNQKALFETKTRKLNRSTGIKFESYLIGTEYDMQFEDAPVKYVVKRLEEKFDVRIVLRDHKGSECLLSADLTDQSLEVALKLISQSMGGTVVNKGDYRQLEIPECK